MEMLGWYAWFALVTAICAIYELVLPVIVEQDNVEYKYIIIATMFFMSLLSAPVVFIACIVPTVGETFRLKLAEGLFPKE